MSKTSRESIDLPPELRSPLGFALHERDSEVLSMVRDALRRRRGHLAYQPVMLSRRPDKPAFWEGLIRIQDATGRTIPAVEFVGSVDMHELGRMIDCIALELGLEALAENQALRLSINMSARSIGYPRWTQILEEGFARDPTSAERLILEISEASAMQMPELVRVFMEKLQLKGVSFALDDFGAGFISLRHLRDFDFDMVKIDGAYIRGVADDPDNQLMVRALVDIARHLEMFTVAESVETREDAEWLIDNGVDCMQGYYFCLPTTRPWFSSETIRRTA